MTSQKKHQLLFGSVGSLIAVALVFLPTVTAFAAEQGGEHGGGHGLAPDFIFWASVINFILFVTLLYALLRKPTGVFLRSRRLQLESLINRVRAEQDEVVRRQAGLEAEISAFARTREERVESAVAAATKEAESLIRAATEQAEQILHDAETRAAMLLQGAASGARDTFVQELLAEVRTQVGNAVNDTVEESYRSLVVESFNGSGSSSGKS